MNEQIEKCWDVIKEDVEESERKTKRITILTGILMLLSTSTLLIDPFIGLIVTFNAIFVSMFVTHHFFRKWNRDIGRMSGFIELLEVLKK